jgi:hypothetical protein
VNVTAPTADTTAGASATSLIGTVQIVAIDAQGTGSANTSGSLATVVLDAPTVDVLVTVHGNGDIGTITVTPPTGTATGTASTSVSFPSIKISAPVVIAEAVYIEEDEEAMAAIQQYEKVIPFIPAFLSYEKAFVDWFRTIKTPRDDSHSLEFRVEYAGGEKAIRAIKALKGDDARNERAKQPVVTLRLQQVEYNGDRYHPPESYVGVLYDGPREQARRAARFSKPSPWKLTYAVEVYAEFEEDLRYSIGTILQRFHHHGGLSYLKMAYPLDFVGAQPVPQEIFPLWLRSYSHNVENGDAERTVKGSLVVQLEAYLGLPFQFVPTFRRYIQRIRVVGSPGEATETERTVVSM